MSLLRMVYRVTVVVVALALASACTRSDGVDVPVAPEPLAADPLDPEPGEQETAVERAGLVGNWTLVALDLENLPALPEQPSMTIQPDGLVFGTSGINRYRTSIIDDDLEQGRIDFGPVSGTLMAGPPEAMRFEDTFNTRLGAISTFRVQGDTLHLYAGDFEPLTLRRDGD